MLGTELIFGHLNWNITKYMTKTLDAGWTERKDVLNAALSTPCIEEIMIKKWKGIKETGDNYWLQKKKTRENAQKGEELQLNSKSIATKPHNQMTYLQLPRALDFNKNTSHIISSSFFLAPQFVSDNTFAAEGRGAGRSKWPRAPFGPR